MIDLATVYTNVTGAFPDVLAQNATGAGLTDGTEFIAAGLNNGPEFGFMQSIMAYGAGGTNAPTGTMGVPNGVSDGEGVSQIIEAQQRGFAIGPGKYVQWGLFDDPSVTLDRVLLLSNQGVLIASFPDLVTECYVGDGNNPTAPFFYKATTAGGGTRDTAGTFFILPPANPTYQRQYIGAVSGGDFVVSAASLASVTQCDVVPYQTSDGAWWLKGNLSVVRTGTSNNMDVTLTGVVFKTGVDQPVVALGNNATTNSSGFASGGTAIINHDMGTATTLFKSSFNVRLDSKPTFADDPWEFPWGITY